MKMVWQGGVYEGEVQNGVPNGVGLLTLKNGIIRGEWQSGELVAGCQYVDDEAYVGGFGAGGSFHGKGFFIHENGRRWRGIWKDGEKVEDPASDSIPNSIRINSYYGHVELESIPEKWFPTHNKVYESGYYRMTESEKYELNVLSEKFGIPVMGLVIKKHNRFDYSRANARAMYFMNPRKPVMYDDAALWTKKGLHYAPFDCRTVEEIHDYIWDFLIENPEGIDLGDRFGEKQREMRTWEYLALDCGIYKGELENGVPNGRGRLIYNHDDPEGRAFFTGFFKDGVPDGSGLYVKLYYKLDAPGGKKYYKGGFKEGLFHCESGYDTLVTEEGYYEGTWREGKLHGENCRIIKGDIKHEGQFCDGEIIKGTLEKPNYKYVGEFKNFLPHGEGMENVEDDIKWNGIFYEGKRLVGFGLEENTNALELYNPNVVKPLEFISFAPKTFELLMRCDSVKFVVNGVTEKMSKKLGVQIALVISSDNGGAQNSMAKRVFGEAATGSIILCGFDGERAVPLSCAVCTKLSELVTEELANVDKAQERGKTELYTAVVLDSKSESDWVITRETHDDYPLEGYEKYEYHEKILLTVGGECYLLDYYHRADYPYDAFDSSVENNIEYYASGKVHKLPDGMTELPAILEYVSSQNKWSAEYETLWFTGTKAEYQKKKIRLVLMNEVVSSLFGCKLEKQV